MRQENQTTRVAVYCRVSKQEMVNSDHCSLDTQEARCRDLARAREWKVVTVLSDASTGANVDRPDLQELLSRAAAREFDTVLLYKVDRLSRSVYDFWGVVNKLQAHGVTVVSVTESFDNGTPQGRLMMTLLASFGEFEREQIRARTRAGLSGRAAAGWWPARHTPFGYRRKSNGDGSPTTLEPDENATRVREAFRRYVDGDGAGLIARWLNDEGARPWDGKDWSGQRVLTMLAQPVYVGVVEWNGVPHDGRHPGIVDPALWQEAQRRRTLGQRGKCRKSRKGHCGDYQLALLGLLRDANGQPFARYWTTNRHGGKFFYYVDPETGRRLNAKALDAEFLRLLRGFMTSPDMFAVTLEEARKLNGVKARRLDDRIEGFRRDIENLAVKEGRLVDAVADGLPADAATDKLNAIRTQRNGLEGRLAEFRGERDLLEQKKEDVNRFARLREFFAAVRDSDSFVDTAEVLHAAVDYVTMDIRAGRGRIVLKLPIVSNPQDAEKGQVSPPAESAATVSPYMPNPGGTGVRAMFDGEGDGARTRNHQIDNLVL